MEKCEAENRAVVQQLGAVDDALLHLCGPGPCTQSYGLIGPGPHGLLPPGRHGSTSKPLDRQLGTAELAEVDRQCRLSGSFGP